MNVAGFVDHVGFDQLGGWCVDRDQPHRPCPVKLVVEGRVTVTVDASRKRPDLIPAGLPTEYGGFRIPLADDLFGADWYVTAGADDTVLPFTKPHLSTTILLARQRCGTNGLRSCLNTHPDLVAYNEIFHPQGTFAKAFDGNFARLVNATNTSLGGVFFPFFHKMMNRYGPQNTSSADAFERLLNGLHAFAPKQHVLIDIKYNSLANVARHWTELGAVPELVNIVKERRINILQLTRMNYLEAYVSAELANKTGVFVLKGKPSSSPDPGVKIKLDCSQLLDTLRAHKAQDERVAGWFSGYDRYLAFDYSELFEEGGVSQQALQQFADLVGIEEPFERRPRTQKIVGRELPEVCVNFREVAKSLRGTEFEYCLKACA